MINNLLAGVRDFLLIVLMLALVAIGVVVVRDLDRTAGEIPSTTLRTSAPAGGVLGDVAAAAALHVATVVR